AVVRRLVERGARVDIVKADVAQQDAVHSVFDTAARSMPPLGGVFHAAGVLDDAAIVSQSWARFARVFATKVAGTWNLHRASLDHPLDFFVCFSSAAAVLGSPGQSNYAAGNAFMDAVAAHR